MKNNIDYIYEYSDLNIFWTRALVLSGKYKDMVVEFGTAYFLHSEYVNSFNLDYKIYTIPFEQFSVDSESEIFLSNLLLSIVDDRKNDPNDREKLNHSLFLKDTRFCNISIDERYYITESNIIKLIEQPVTVGLGDF